MSALRGMDRSTTSGPPAEQLVEVWGDTVDRRQVIISVVLSCVLAASTFFVAEALFPRIVDNANLARTYSMLLGLLAALIAAIIAARRFPPKRQLVEGSIDVEQQLEVLRELAREPGGLGKVAELSVADRKELEELNLLDLFQTAEAEVEAAERTAEAEVEAAERTAEAEVEAAERRSQ